MGTIHEVTASEATVDHDISSPLTAAAFTVRYGRVDGSQVWDPALYDTLALYRGEADPDLVRIKATFDGVLRDLILGVVDASGHDKGGDGMVGTLAGRDRLALALDGHPAVGFTITGPQISGTTLVPQTTFKTAMADLANRAGLGIIFNIGADDYGIGRAVPVTTEATYGEVMEELLAPWRLSEKHAIDAWVEGTNLLLVRRGLGDAVNVTFERLGTTGNPVVTYEKTTRLAANDVQVLGATYDVLVPKSGFCEHYRYYTTSFEADPPHPATDYDEVTLEEYDADCLLVRKLVTRTYADGNRTEVTETFWAYYGGTGAGAGKVYTATETLRVRDTRQTPTLFYVVTKATARTWEYFADTGDTLAETEDEKVWNEDDLRVDSGAAYATRKLTTYRYRRSARQIMRDTEVQESDGTTGEVLRSFKTEEVGPQSVGGVTSAVPFDKDQETRQVSCGPDDARRKETNELLGDATVACLIRGRIQDDHDSIKVSISCAMAPDHRITPGIQMTVVGAPAWWDVTTFTVLSVHRELRAKGALQTIRAVGWLIP